MAELRDSLERALGDAYALGKELGGGGMSRVFMAQEAALNRPVVIKALLPELASGVSAQRFAREVHAAAMLQSPHIVPVLCAGHTADQIPYYIMPFVRGESLRARLTRGRIPYAETVQIMGDVAKALAVAHEAGMVHRDIKPDNILLTGDAASVTDFGIARAIDEARAEGVDPMLTSLGSSVGTPGYMAPEQAYGDPIDARTDVYSWGVVAYEMIAGHHPFPTAHTAQRLIAAQIAERPVPLSTHQTNTPAWFCNLVMSCLAKEPALRPANGQALVHAVEYGEAGQPFREHRLGSPPRLVLHDKAFATSTRRHWSDIVGCLAFFAIAVWDVRIAPAVSLALVPVFGYEIAAGLAFLTRRRPMASLRGWGPRAAAYGGTFIVPVFLAVAASRAPAWLTPVTRSFPAAGVWLVPAGNILVLAGAALSAWGLWHLRASISLEPAARGLVTRGPYSVARHPLYLAYLFSYTGVVLQHPTPQVAIMFISWFAMTWARIRYEEGVLVAVYPEYSEYRARVGAFGPKLAHPSPSTQGK